MQCPPYHNKKLTIKFKTVEDDGTRYHCNCENISMRCVILNEKEVYCPNCKKVSNKFWFDSMNY
jgi:hypothetical protein